MRFILLILTFCSLLPADEQKVIVRKSCPAFAFASSNSKPICRLEKGAKIFSGEKAKGNFFYIRSKNCVGYVQRGCLAKGKETRETASEGGFDPSEEKRRKAVDKLVSSSREKTRRSMIQMGAVVGVDGVWGTVGYDSTNAGGFGWQLGAKAYYELKESIFLSVDLTYQSVKLSRQIDLSGTTREANPVEFAQKVNYIGLGLKGLYEFSELSFGAKGGSPWGIEAGVDILYPLSGSQSDVIFGDRGVDVGETQILLLVGPQGSMEVGNAMRLSATLQGYYGLTGTEGNRLFGVRLGLALLFGVL